MQHGGDLERLTPVPDPRPDDTVWPQLSWPIPIGTQLIGDTVQLSALDPATDAAELLRALDHDQVWEHVPGRPADAACPPARSSG